VRFAINVFIATTIVWSTLKLLGDSNPIWAIASMVAASDPQPEEARRLFRAGSSTCWSAARWASACSSSAAAAIGRSLRARYNRADLVLRDSHQNHVAPGSDHGCHRDRRRNLQGSKVAGIERGLHKWRGDFWVRRGTVGELADVEGLAHPAAGQGGRTNMNSGKIDGQSDLCHGSHQMLRLIPSLFEVTLAG